MTAVDLDPQPDVATLCDLAPVRRAGWEVVEIGGWVLCSPPGLVLPEAGWKVHLSASVQHWGEVVEIARDVALELGLAVKFLPTPVHAKAINSKGTPRTSSGKLVCLYTTSEASLERAVRLLRRRTAGMDGPDILTDLRCGPEPVFIRFGGFEEAWCFRRGERVLAIRHPEGGLVPDEGRFRWSLPPWVPLPSWASPHLEARGQRYTRLPCGIVKALQFSSAGGVYLGVMRDTGRDVVVKEARPFAGLDSHGQDAVARLEREEELLRALAPSGLVPASFGLYAGTRHRYLVRELLQGETVAQERWRRWPWNAALEPTQRALREYACWAVDRLEQVRDLLRQLHAEGYAVHDLHPGNLFVEEASGALKLFDLETLTPVTSTADPAVIAPDYSAPEGGDGWSRDAYAYRVLAHALFSPTVRGWSDPSRRASVRASIRSAFGPDLLADLDRRTATPGPPAGPEPAASPDQASLRRLVDGCVERSGRDALRGTGVGHLGLLRGEAGTHLARALHPGVPTGPADRRRAQRLSAALPTLELDLSLATGSSGLVLALTASGVGVDLTAWARGVGTLLEDSRVERHLLHGVPGVALAVDVAGRCTGWRPDPRLLDQMSRVMGPVRPGDLGGPGLLHGDAGVALFWSVMHRAGVPGAGDRVGGFLPLPDPGQPVLPGGLAGVGGWALAVAMCHESLEPAVRAQVRETLARPLFHRDGGLQDGLAGTLLGLTVLDRRHPGLGRRTSDTLLRQVPAWCGDPDGEGPSVLDPDSARVSDTLQAGTLGLMIVDGLRRRAGQVRS